MREERGKNDRGKEKREKPGVFGTWTRRGGRGFAFRASIDSLRLGKNSLMELTAFSLSER